MWDKAVSLIMIFFSAFVVLSCMQNLNSNSNDDSFKPSPAIDTSNPEGQRYSAAMTVIENHCIACHGAWSAYTSEAAWVASPLVVKNSSVSSPLYYRNSGSSGGAGPKDMPVGGNLSGADLDALASWIDEML
jgi:mono/diheme cytochrome c family protein